MIAWTAAMLNFGIHVRLLMPSTNKKEEVGCGWKNLAGCSSSRVELMSFHFEKTPPGIKTQSQ